MVILTLFIYVSAIALSFLKTSDLDDLSTITDEFALLPKRNVVPPPIASGTEKGRDDHEDWIPEVYDLPVSFVNETMFKES